MATPLHDIFTKCVVKAVELQLQKLGLNESKPEVASLAQSIEDFATSRLFVQNETHRSKHAPDGSFYRVGAKYPPLVIETSFTQKRQDLPRLANEYIAGSSGNIKMMIGLDIQYRQNKRATVSVWEPKIGTENGVTYQYVEKTVDNEVSSPPEAGLALVIPLSVFLFPHDAPLSDVAISIPFTTLHSCLEGAEVRHQFTISGFTQPHCLLPWRWRERTLEEQLKDEDEAQFVASERRAERVASEE